MKNLETPKRFSNHSVVHNIFHFYNIYTYTYAERYNRIFICIQYGPGLNKKMPKNHFYSFVTNVHDRNQ